MTTASDKLASDAVKAAQLIKTTAEQTATSINISYIQKDMVEVKQTLKEMIGVFVTTKDFAEHEKRVDDHEVRIRTLEEGMWKLVGVSSIIASIITVLGTFLLKLI